jgi:hypothetical protein
MPALPAKQVAAPLMFQGSCNTEVVDVYFEQVLLPALPPGSVIVLVSPVPDDAEAVGSRWLPVAVPAVLFARSQPHRTSLGRLQDPSAPKPLHRHQPLPFHRQYVPMFLLFSIEHKFRGFSKL